jgi:hypothetical protein
MECWAAFPEQPDAMFTTAIALYPCVLLAEHPSTDRAREIDYINALLVTMGYELSPLN